MTTSGTACGKPIAGHTLNPWQGPTPVREFFGNQVNLFLVEGTPGGLMTAEITNRTGSIGSARRE